MSFQIGITFIRALTGQTGPQQEWTEFRKLSVIGNRKSLGKSTRVGVPHESFCYESRSPEEFWAATYPDVQAFCFQDEDWKTARIQLKLDSPQDWEAVANEY